MSSTLADLQRRNIEKMGSPEKTQPDSVLTGVRTYGSTEEITDGITEARKEVITEVITPVRKPVRADVSKSAHKDVPKPEHKNAFKDTFLEVVDIALASREPLTGGVKATVDMSPDLSTRAKRYLADHRGQNTRQVLIALFDAFLTAKGY